MKSFFFSALMIAVWLNSYAQTLFSYGKHNVDKEEFLRQFNRNLNPQEDHVKALKEYLPLFINYKLKVQDAYDNRLDTQYNQLTELSDFRRQIADNYFSEEANLNNLANEAFFRSQKDIQLQDIIIGFDPKNPQRIKEAEEVAEKAIQKLTLKTDFNKVLDEYCTDKDCRDKHGNMGWITVFSLPYKIENIAYNMKVGEFSEPIKTTNAFHIFKKVAERKAAGKIRVAQILFAYAPDATKADKEQIQKKVDSVYEALTKGADFSALAHIYSADRSSYQNGGVLPEFGVGFYDQNFEEAAFSLKNKEDISKPFSTSFGIHILKLIDRIPVVTDQKDPIMMSNLKQRIMSDNRMEQAKNTLIKNILPKIGYQLSKTLNKKSLWNYTDSILAKTNTKNKDISDQTEIFRFTKQPITVANWIMFVTATRNNSANKSYEDLFEKYVNITATEYYKKHLEAFNPDFKHQLQEFKDANLNFEITEKMIWSKAAADSIGLATYYNANRTKYQWAPSVNAIIVSGRDSATIAVVKEEIQANVSNWKRIVLKYENKILADSNRFEQKLMPIDSTISLKEKMLTPTIVNKEDHSFNFCYIINVINKPELRSFEEARGFVINDYQQIMETRWIDNLKKKYPVKIYDGVWKELLKK